MEFGWVRRNSQAIMKKRHKTIARENIIDRAVAQLLFGLLILFNASLLEGLSSIGSTILPASCFRLTGSVVQLAGWTIASGAF